MKQRTAELGHERKIRNTYRILVRNLKGRDHLGNLGVDD
jgi:hypothetical protein